MPVPVPSSSTISLTSKGDYVFRYLYSNAAVFAAINWEEVVVLDVDNKLPLAYTAIGIPAAMLLVLLRLKMVY
jgi:hypothetical protein